MESWPGFVQVGVELTCEIINVIMSAYMTKTYISVVDFVKYVELIYASHGIFISDSDEL